MFECVWNQYKLLKKKKYIYTAVKFKQLYKIRINNNKKVNKLINKLVNLVTDLWLNRFGLVEGVSCQHIVLYCGLAYLV